LVLKLNIDIFIASYTHFPSLIIVRGNFNLRRSNAELLINIPFMYTNRRRRASRCSDNEIRARRVIWRKKDV